ncbi:MAG: hypothetical protein MRY83_12025 [Flavobacteriales bacterium]|nr:hypothetical protein [Flavobacteriales bacterium]
MKSIKLIITVLALTSLVITGCRKEQNEPIKDSQSVLPTNFKVDIPDAISHESAGGGKTTGTDTLGGNQIYGHLANFIAVGEGAAEIVQHIMIAIAVYDLDQAMTFSYQSDDDNRTKDVEIVENVSFEGVNYGYRLTIWDAASTSNPDGGYAMQVFWNNSPVEGVALIKLYNLDRTGHQNAPDAMIRVDYTQSSSLGYDEHMIVYIADLPVASPLTDLYAVDNMKMFAGRTGTTVDVFGNSNHPNAKFFNDSVGYNWAFVAAGRQDLDIGVAEVGIPLSNTNSTDRQVLLVDNSIQQVFSDQIHDTWPGIDSATVAGYLYNTEAPGYFDQGGFVQAGTSPSSNYSSLDTRLPNMTPYNPLDVKNLSINFQ